MPIAKRLVENQLLANDLDSADLSLLSLANCLISKDWKSLDQLGPFVPTLLSWTSAWQSRTRIGKRRRDNPEASGQVPDSRSNLNP